MGANANSRVAISRKAMAAILIAWIAALVARSVLQVELLSNGVQSVLAADISYLLVPVAMAGLLFPLWRTERSFLGTQFRCSDLTWRIASSALATGLLIRLMWWCQLVIGISFGFYRNTDSSAVIGPTFSFQCGAPWNVALGILVMTVLVPAAEELVNRGYVLRTLRRRGFLVSILLSALVFAVFHRLTSWPFAFFAGIVLGVQYWSTRSLWSSLITHSTVNGLILIDWRCLSGQWNPRAHDLPILHPGLTAIAVLFICTALLLMLLRRTATGA